MTPNDLPPSYQRSSLEGKVAVVTGSTQGLGEATARLFRERGCKGLVITGRNKDRGKRLVKELTSELCKVIFVRADLENIDEVRNILKVTDTTFGTLDILVNAAATTDRGSLWDTTPEDYDRIMNINARAPFFLMQDAARIMEREKIAGSIINISSTASYGSLPMLAAYGMSKGALNVATKNAAYSLMWSKIRVNTLAIGWMDTPGEDTIQRKLHSDGSTGDHWKAIGEASQPFGRLLQPDEVARCIAFCASEESGMMTGCVIDFDQSVWGAGNAPVPPKKEEWAKANGMTFSFESKKETTPQEPLQESTPWSTPKNMKKKKVSKPKITNTPSPTQDEETDSTKAESKSLSATPKSFATPKTTPKRSPKSTTDMPIIPALTSSPQKSPAVTKSRTKAGLASPTTSRRNKKEEKPTSAATNASDETIKTGTFSFSKKKKKEDKPVVEAVNEEDDPIKSLSTPTSRRKKKVEDAIEAAANVEDETIKIGSSPISRRKKEEDKPVEAATKKDEPIKSLSTPTSRRKKKMRKPAEAVNKDDETVKTRSFSFSKRKKEEENIKDAPAEAVSTSRRKEEGKPAEAANEKDEAKDTEITPPVSPKPMALKKQNSVDKQIAHFEEATEKDDTKQTETTPFVSLEPMALKKQNSVNKQIAHFEATKESESTPPVSPKPMALKKQNSIDKQIAHFEAANEKEDTKQIEISPPVSPNPTALKIPEDTSYKKNKQDKPAEAAVEKDDAKEIEITPPVSPNPIALDDPEDKPYQKKKQDQPAEAATEKDETKQTEAAPPVSPKPTALKKQNPADKPYPDEDRPDPAEFIRMLRMEDTGAKIETDNYLPGTDPFAGAQERKDRAELRYGGNSAPSSPSPKSPKQTRFDPSTPDDVSPLVTGVRKLQDAGKNPRPDEYFSGNDPYAKKQERVKKFGSNSNRDYRAAKVDEWLGGSGKPQRRSYRVKKVRDLMSEETAEE